MDLTNIITLIETTATETDMSSTHG